ncbi:MAG: GIY-YIG nuclease family protein, partial [Phycisphaerales bacterium JB038]
MPDRRPKLDDLLAQAHDLPAEPGVYLMKNAEGVVLYVGKAISLRNRVTSYFVPSADLGPKKQVMLDEVDHFDHLLCESEWEALLTENRLIKDIQPKYNERLTDGKSFPYLAITMRDQFPGVFITRSPGDEQFKGAKIFGRSEEHT